MQNPSASMLVIGDEILSGRTRDSNMHYLAIELTKVGIDLKEVRVVSDSEVEIVQTVTQLSEKYDYVFTSGGIGPTHDDITADAIGLAFNLEVKVCAEAKKILENHYLNSEVELNEARLRMARTPVGAKLIKNSVSAAPGFNVQNVFVMAGVPSVFQVMVQSVIKTINGGQPVLSRSLNISSGEGNIAEKLKIFAQDNKLLAVGSYPFQKNGKYGTNIVIRGKNNKSLDKAFNKLLELFSGMIDEP
jgi:molybdenum cofactor synthesis domain-containing protein